MCDEIKIECCKRTDPPWESPQVIPAQIRRVDNLIFRKINQFARENGVEQATPMHGWIIEYLYRHRNEPVFQRDIEREFSITRSTVTNILQLMERKGYIQRLSVPQDARLKQLVLTEDTSPHLTDDLNAQKKLLFFPAGKLGVLGEEMEPNSVIDMPSEVPELECALVAAGRLSTFRLSQRK